MRSAVAFLEQFERWSFLASITEFDTVQGLAGQPRQWDLTCVCELCLSTVHA